VKTKRVLGLDLGSCAFKAVLLEFQDSKPVLLHARLLEIPAQAEPSVRLAALKSLLEGIELSHLSQVASVVDDPFACVHQVTVPPMPAAELAGAVKWELQRFLSVPPEDVVVDYKPWGEEEVSGVKKQRLVAVALPAAAIRDQLSFLSSAGIRPTHLIPKASALGAWLTRASGGPSAVLEVGGSGCEFVVAEKGHAIFTRKIPGGGALLTKEMTGVLMTEQGQVSLTEGEAETVKRSIGIPQGDAGGMGMKGVSGMQIFSLIRGGLERLAVDAERSLSFYGESGGQGVIGEVALAGGGAHLKGLAEWLQARIGIRVTGSKPFEGIHLAPGALQGPAAVVELSFAAVLGAALGAGRSMNLLPAEMQEGLKASIQRAALKAAVTGGLLSAAFLWIGLQTYHRSILRQTAAYELEQRAIAPQVPAVRAAFAARDRWQGEPDWKEIFRKLTHQVPPEIYLTEWSVDGKEMMIRGRVRKEGRPADEVLNQFTRALREGAVREATLRSSRQLDPSTDQAEFEIGGILK